jgi:methylated-DNA-[protein]-cysteine S-methyltransferase
MNLIIEPSNNESMRHEYTLPSTSIYRYCYQDSVTNIHLYSAIMLSWDMNNNLERPLNFNDEYLNSHVETEDEGSVVLSAMISAKRGKIVSQRKIKNEDVYNLLQKIPAGKVSTYGDLAKALGNPSASRTIGRILGENPNPIEVPCHRVVMSDGKVGGYAYGTARKRQLLEKEGVSFLNGSVRDFKQVRVSLSSNH